MKLINKSNFDITRKEGIFNDTIKVQTIQD